MEETEKMSELCKDCDVVVSNLGKHKRRKRCKRIKEIRSERNIEMGNRLLTKKNDD